jgi:hypothetical protein
MKIASFAASTIVCSSSAFTFSLSHASHSPTINPRPPGQRRAYASYFEEGKRVLSESDIVNPLIEAPHAPGELTPPFISTPPMIFTRVTVLISENENKNSTDNVIKRSKELYGYTPEEKSDQNMEWMLQNGYLQKKRHKRGTRGRRTKTK